MSIVSKLTEAVVHFLPDRDRDELSESQKIIGKPLDRLDGRLKVMGEATFTAEFALENLAHAALTYSTIARGKIKNINVDAAEKAPGVLAVLTHENAPRRRTRKHRRTCSVKIPRSSSAAMPKKLWQKLSLKWIKPTPRRGTITTHWNCMRRQPFGPATN